MKPYYTDEYITLYNADCRDVLPLLKEQYFGWTDPPYNVGKNYGVWNDSLSDEEYLNFCINWLAWFQRLCPENCGELIMLCEPLYFLGCNFPEKIASLNCPVMLSVNGFFKKRGDKYTCRKAPFDGVQQPIIFDSGAFSRISRQYGYKNHLPTKTYAQVIWRFKNCCNLVAVVVQDYMCEEYILSITGLDIPTHQRLTLHRYDRLVEELDRLAQATGETPPYIMPVLQGYERDDYLRHLDSYGSRLKTNDWIGIGSVCKRNANPGSIWAILNRLPDGFHWHGFGVKRTALTDAAIRGCFYSVDSQAGGLGSFGKPRKQTKYQYSNDWNHALNYRDSVVNSPVQLSLLPQLFV